TALEQGGTMTAGRMMTPEFASPEQISGEPVTTATDVFSLGLLLSFLLTGHHLARREDEFQRPSAAAAKGLRRIVAGDLDSIVLKAVRREPGLRYSSAEELAADIRRYREGLPVLARKGTTRYL